MKKRYLLLFALLGIFLVTPALLHLSWRLAPTQVLDILLVNKTVTPARDYYHQGYDWIFIHDKYLNNDSTSYEPGLNQMGFFPQQNGDYLIRDMEGASQEATRELVRTTDLVYYADNYGVYYHDWYREEIQNFDSVPNTMIYGGLQQHDIDFIGQMLQEDKAVIAEYNFFSPPTTGAIREQAQQLLDLQWQGWQGKYFPSLRLGGGHQIPSWLVTLYQTGHRQPWDFKNQGIGFIHEDNTVVILEYPRHLKEASFNIITPEARYQLFGIPEKVPFPGWFEITFPTNARSKVISWYEIPVNEQGKALLEKHGIPLRFPAVIYRENPGRFWYLAGDFGKGEMPSRFVRLQGARYLELLFTDLLDPAVRKGFFFSYYLPLASGILRDISLQEADLKQARLN
ncbi:MAG: hypothetical protein R6U64_07235 [Bacteroidales bacterium]